MKVWIRKPEKEGDAPFLMAEHKGASAFADLNVLARGALGLLLAALLPAMFRREKAPRGTPRRKGAFRGRRRG